MYKLILVFSLLFSPQVFAQASASATVESRATVIDPIQIEKTVDLDFGNVISAYTPGTVILSPEGTRVAYGVLLSNSIPGNVAPAEAVVTHGNHNYAISLPDSFTLYHQENPNQVLIIEDFTVTPLPGEERDVLRIGATLKLEANQVSGYYTNSAGFNVTVSYN
ncbi:DUF4402 domain-containing protein [Salinimicrobium oceani]|uniref:DUF4402 domain-containing protein n=1 Tax=Salinimicrobium oceani TaxID=2722702 RepID=A0ABX1CYJ9_9FLAO|nr:DUF4402 domain-containing protein [Salinimicrobium oceani]NJW53343.1 DUF4402 domain-containing protein [Salinimicrobium oceani]